MTEASTSLTEHVRSLEAGENVVSAAFLGDTPAFALAEGQVWLGAAEPKRVAAHPDAAILVVASDGQRLLTGGDDGRVLLLLL